MKCGLFLLCCVLIKSQYNDEGKNTISFDQFVMLYQKQYKEDEYADRRVNFVENSKRMLQAKKLSGMTISVSYYSDYSEVRFRKMLMSNLDNSQPNLNEIDIQPPIFKEVMYQKSWSYLLPKIINVDPMMKCASSWAVAITSYLYILYKRQDPLWTDHFSVQQLIDCVIDRKTYNQNTCEGATIESGLRYIFEKGICLEHDYEPYSGIKNRCHRIYCNRYYIKQYSRLFPSIQTILQTLEIVPILSTIGVHPDLLQFYTSYTDKQINFMQGTFHRYHISGIISKYSFNNTLPYMVFTIPNLFYQSRDIYYSLISNTTIDNNYGNIDELAYYAYTTEIITIPKIRHNLKCSKNRSYLCLDNVMESVSFLIYLSKCDWIVPWSSTLYSSWTLWGIHRDELTTFLIDAVRGLEYESDLDEIPAVDEYQDDSKRKCHLDSLQLTGLYLTECPYSVSRDLDSLGVDVEQSECQLNSRCLDLIKQILGHCRSIHTLELIDHSFNVHEVLSLLKFVIDQHDKKHALTKIVLSGNFVDEALSYEVNDQIKQLNKQGIDVQGLVLFSKNYSNSSIFIASIANRNPPKQIIYDQPIDESTLWLIHQASPLRLASKVSLTHSCIGTVQACYYFAEQLSYLFDSFPHFYLRHLDLSYNSISTEGALRLLLVMKYYPRLSTFILDYNHLDDSFVKPFQLFIQDSLIFTSLRRISIQHNYISQQSCQMLQTIFLTQYHRSTTVIC